MGAKVKFNYMERDRTLTISANTGITISIYGQEQRDAVKQFLGIYDAADYLKEKEIPEGIWDRFLMMEY